MLPHKSSAPSMIPIFTVIIFPRMEYRFFFFPAIVPPHFYPPFSYKGIIPCRKREVTPLTVPAQQKEAIAVRAISCICRTAAPSPPAACTALSP